jgi:hypothetical protein
MSGTEEAIDERAFRRTTRKEVSMSGKMRILGLACAAGLIVVCAGIAFGQANQDPCDGHYAGEGLRAMFWAPNSIFNDIPNLWYQYQVPGGDCVFLYRAGHVVVSIKKARSTRWVAMQFDPTLKPEEPPTDPCNTLPSFMTDGIGIDQERAGTFSMKLVNEWLGSEGNDGTHFGLVLTAANRRLNFAAMAPGQTAYCDLGVEFTLDPGMNDSDTYKFNGAAKVYYGFLEETGALGWRVTPIYEHVWVLTYETTRVKGKTTVKLLWTEHLDYVTQTIRSETCPDDFHATFYFPFTLILERLR